MGARNLTKEEETNLRDTLEEVKKGREQELERKEPEMTGEVEFSWYCLANPKSGENFVQRIKVGSWTRGIIADNVVDEVPLSFEK